MKIHPPIAVMTAYAMPIVVQVQPPEYVSYQESEKRILTRIETTEQVEAMLVQMAKMRGAFLRMASLYSQVQTWAYDVSKSSSLSDEQVKEWNRIFGTITGIRESFPEENDWAKSK